MYCRKEKPMNCRKEEEWIVENGLHEEKQLVYRRKKNK